MHARTVYIETFGCQMNELDSELVGGQLRALGYQFTQQDEAADVILYNTCSVRDHAEQKVRSRLGELRERKKQDPGLIVGVLGCMAERDGSTLTQKFPVVDLLVGPGELDKLPGMLDNAVRTRDSLLSEPPAGDSIATPRRSRPLVALQGNTSRRSATLAAAEDTLELLDLSRAVSPDSHDGSAYVRITRGCNKFCTYCVVPNTRGAEIHRPPDHIIDECKRLADAGVIEVTLLGQTVNHYRFEHGSAVTVGGVIQPQKGRSYLGGHRRDPFAGEKTTTFADLLARIHEEVPAIRRLRFVTSYPRDFGDDVLEVIRHSPRICRYLHVPAQSGSDAVLRRMNRGYSVSEYLEFIDRARSFLDQPEIGRPLTIAGDLIAGFCGETEEDHQATLELIRRARYKNAFIFRYSPRPGTTAFDRLPDDVPEEVKRRRVNELLAEQHLASEEVSRSYIGRTVEVFVQGLSPTARKRERQAPPSETIETTQPAARAISLTIHGQPSEGHQSACSLASSSKTMMIGESEPVIEDAFPTQMTGRTEGDLIVVFDRTVEQDLTELVGSLVHVRVESATHLTLSGHRVG